MKVGTDAHVARRRGAPGLPVLAFVNGSTASAPTSSAAVAIARASSRRAARARSRSRSAARTAVEGVDRRARAAGARAGRRERRSREAQRAAAAAARDQLVEAVAECDDALLEKYLEEGELSDEEVARGLVAGVRAGPHACRCSAARPRLASVGVARCSRRSCACSPRPPSARSRGTRSRAARAQPRRGPAGPSPRSSSRPSSTATPARSRCLRIVSGTLQPDSHAPRTRRPARAERLGKLLLLRGAEHVDVPEAGPGDVVAVAKLKDVPHRPRAHRRRRAAPRSPRSRSRAASLSYAIAREARRTTRTSSSPRSAGSWRRTRRSTLGRDPSDRRVPADRHGRAPHPHRRRAPAADVRRRGRAAARRRCPTARRSGRARERRGQAEEADRRQGHVRRSAT